MPQKIAVALIHGIGRHHGDLVQDNMAKMKAALEAQVARALDLPDAAAVLAVERVFWGPVLHTLEQKLWDRVDAHPEGKKLDFITFRRLLIDYAGDALAYQPIPIQQGTAQRRDIYNHVHLVFAETLKRLADAAGPTAPLCIIAHSLGTVIASNYLYDLQQDYGPSPPPSRSRMPGPQREPHVPPVVRERGMHETPTPLEMGHTLAWFYTMGSPLAVWGLRYDDFGQPVQVPPPQLAGHYPGLPDVKRWINFYDDDDIAGFPLTILPNYEPLVADRCVNVGGFLSSMTPLSHTGYWLDADVVGPIAQDLAATWRAINP